MQFHISFCSAVLMIGLCSLVSFANGGYIVQQSVQPLPGRLKVYSSPPQRKRPAPIKTFPRSPPAYAAENQLLAQAIRQALEIQGALGQRPNQGDIEIQRARISEQFVLPHTPNSPVTVQNFVVQPPSQGYSTSQRTSWTPVVPSRSNLPNRNIVQYRHNEVKSPPQNSEGELVRLNNNNHGNNFIPQAIQIADSYENYNTLPLEEVKFVEERRQQQIFPGEVKNEIRQFNSQVTTQAAQIQNAINVSPSDPVQVLPAGSGYNSPPALNQEVIQVSQIKEIQPQLTSQEGNGGVSKSNPIQVLPANSRYISPPDFNQKVIQASESKKIQPQLTSQEGNGGVLKVAVQQQQQGSQYYTLPTSTPQQSQANVHTTYEFYKHSEPQVVIPEVIKSQPEQQNQQQTSAPPRPQIVKALSPEEEFPFPTISIAGEPVVSSEPQAQLQEVSAQSRPQMEKVVLSQPQKDNQAQQYSVIQPQQVVAHQQPQQIVPQYQQFEAQQPQQVTVQQPQTQGYIVSQPQKVAVPQSQGYAISQPPTQEYIISQPQKVATLRTEGYTLSQPQKVIVPQQTQGYAGSQPQKADGYAVSQPQQVALPQTQGYTESQPQKVVAAQQTQGYAGSQPEQAGGYAGSQPQQAGGYAGSQPQQAGGYAGSQPQQAGGYAGSQPQQVVQVVVPQAQGYTVSQPQQVAVQQSQPQKVAIPQTKQHSVSQPQKVVIQQSEPAAPQSQKYVVFQRGQIVPQLQQQQQQQYVIQSQNSIAFEPQQIAVNQQQQYVIAQPQQVVVQQPQLYTFPQPQQLFIQQPQQYIISQQQQAVPQPEEYVIQSQNSIVPEPQQTAVHEQQQYVITQPRQVVVQQEEVGIPTQFQLQQFSVAQPELQVVSQPEKIAVPDPNSQSQEFARFQREPVTVSQSPQSEVQEAHQQYTASQPQQVVQQSPQVSNSQPQQQVADAPERQEISFSQSESQSSPVTFTAPIVSAQPEIQLQDVRVQSQPASPEEPKSSLVFVNAAPGETARKPIAESIPSPGQENHQIIFVKTPNPMGAQRTYQVEVGPNPPQETKVYVLQSHPEVNHEVTINQPPAQKVDPEIHFVRYAESDLLPHQTISEFNRVTEERGPLAKTYDVYAPQMPHEIYYTHPV